MKHLSEGTLRGYHDGELSEAERVAAASHLAECRACHARSLALEQRGKQVRAHLGSLDPMEGRVPISPAAASYRLAHSADLTKEATMLQRVFGRRSRPFWAAAAAVLVLAVAFSFAPVRALAGEFLALFRVQKIQFVQVDPSAIPNDETLDSALTQLEAMLQEQMSIETEGEERTVTPEEASVAAGFRVRFPAQAPAEPQIVTVEPEVRAATRIDREQMNRLFDELGYAEIDLPESIDGAEVSIDIRPIVVTTYGVCRAQQTAAIPPEGQAAMSRDCVVFLQAPTPQVVAPDEIPTEQLGQLYLQMLGISAEDAGRMSARVDWTSTLLVPIPRGYGFVYEDIAVDGVLGQLVSAPAEEGEGYRPEYALVWVKNGILYGISGAGDAALAIDMANSLR